MAYNINCQTAYYTTENLADYYQLRLTSAIASEFIVQMFHIILQFDQFGLPSNLFLVFLTEAVNYLYYITELLCSDLLTTLVNFSYSYLHSVV